jgi:hypothetical protein
MTKFCATPENYYTRCLPLIPHHTPIASIHCSVFESMQEQHTPTPRIASESYVPHESSELQCCAVSSEYSSVVDWIPEPAAPSDTQPSDESDPRSTSEGSSSQWTESASDSRRPNPKLIKARAESRAVSMSSDLPSDDLVIDYKYRVHTKQLGHLYGLCDAVPYLLGPRSYLKAIVAFDNHPVPMEAYQDQEGNFVIDPHKMTVLDKVFLMMLWLLRIPVDRRPADWENLYMGMSVQKDRLVIYKDIGFGTYHHTANGRRLFDGAATCLEMFC